MGDYILMEKIKIIFLILFILPISLLSNINKIEIKNDTNNELKWVNEQIKAIKPPRKGVNLKYIYQIKRTFVFLEKNKTKKSNKEKSSKKHVKNSIIPPLITNSSQNVKQNLTMIKKSKSLKLFAIMNKSALINGKWYKLGEYVDGYKIVKVTPKVVTLNKKGVIKKLTTDTKKPIK